jgi:hypothetical protein
LVNYSSGIVVATFSQILYTSHIVSSNYIRDIDFVNKITTVCQMK